MHNYARISLINISDVPDGEHVIVMGRYERHLNGATLSQRGKTLDLVGEPFDWIPPQDAAVEVWGVLWQGPQPRLVVHNARQVGDTTRAPEQPKEVCVGDTVTLTARVTNYADQQVTTEFQNKLIMLESKGWLRLQRYNNLDVGEYWKVYYTPEARKRFAIPGSAPVRKDQVQTLCFGPQKATYLEKQGPVELVNGVPRVMVQYRVKAQNLPKWADDPELDDVVWQRPPASEESGTMRMYIGGDGHWKVDPTFNPQP